ncbi:flavodoxin [Periweissella cryptocerci]|uniref:Flavodoxin n=1 Tax=Periweissella cryptocerci TaxID=2506420 RepID=A0A4P6YVR6_9LACO|nr:flavodoxin domain-containing protein [Periweissella cryptocerci]QBO36843.1 flavodoxin [Periweissella cryptocerci]
MTRKKIAVIYKAKIGMTKQYATWIAEAFKADLLELSEIEQFGMLKYDLVIFGGAISAGTIRGINDLMKRAYRELVIFTVGMTPPSDLDHHALLERNIPADRRTKTPVFHFHGGFDCKMLGFFERTILVPIKSFILKLKPTHKLTADERAFLKYYDKQVDLCKWKSILPLLEYVHEKVA